MLNEVINAALPPAPTDDAPEGTTATGLPICVPPLKNVTVPVAPRELLLPEEIVAVKVIFVPVVVVGVLVVSTVAVAAFATVTESVTGVVTAL